MRYTYSHWNFPNRSSISWDSPTGQPIKYAWVHWAMPSGSPWARNYFYSWEIQIALGMSKIHPLIRNLASWVPTGYCGGARVPCPGTLGNAQWVTMGKKKYFYSWEIQIALGISKMHSLIRNLASWVPTRYSGGARVPCPGHFSAPTFSHSQNNPMDGLQCKFGHREITADIFLRSIF